MGVFVSTVSLGMDLCGVGHESPGMQRVRLGEQRVMSRLGVVAEIVPFGGKLVIVGSRPVMFGGEQMGLDGGMSRHEGIVAPMRSALLRLDARQESGE
jgi:hypothetical protein